MSGSNHHESQSTTETRLPNSNHLEAIRTDPRVSGLLKTFGESLVTKEELAQLFQRHPASIQRAVECGELPPPMMLLGNHYWTVDVLARHFEKRLETAAHDIERATRNVQYFKAQSR
jgi:hypothetical protein